MGGQWRQVLPAFLMFSYIFTWIKYYKYFHLDFSAGLLTNVRATGDGWELYTQPGLELEGPRRFLHCCICRVLWDCCYDLRIVRVVLVRRSASVGGQTSLSRLRCILGGYIL